MKIRDLLHKARVPAVTAPLTCNYCLSKFWPNLHFYYRMAPLIVKSFHWQHTLGQVGFACGPCADAARESDD